MINVLTTEPKFMFIFTWDREWLKKLKGDRKVKFFQKFENHWVKQSFHYDTASNLIIN